MHDILVRVALGRRFRAAKEVFRCFYQKIGIFSFTPDDNE